jgi:hypothetical protein
MSNFHFPLPHITFQYVNHLNPRLKSTEFTALEDATIWRLYATVGTQWAKMSKVIPGRTDNNLKNRFHNLKRQLLREEDSRLRAPEPAGYAGLVHAGRVREVPHFLRTKIEDMWNYRRNIGLVAAGSAREESSSAEDGAGGGGKDEEREGAGSSSPSAVGDGGGGAKQDAAVRPVRGRVGAEAVRSMRTYNAERPVRRRNVHEDEVVQGLHESFDAPRREHPQGVHESEEDPRRRAWGGRG